MGQNWQDQYARFFTELKEDLARIENQASLDQAIAAMNKVLDDYAARREERRTGSK
ncbi:hypothetical protein WBP06_20315 [Novosphingobium sp. BL-8H]|uniref:hypothetical protein n=1 Tax=Novosphingobium sp. BL-8H TaxID=3127640 RepID=UPI0037569709